MRTSGVACPQCGGTQTDVFDTQHRKAAIYRRRRCLVPTCGHRWNTYEVPAARVNRVQVAS